MTDEVGRKLDVIAAEVGKVVMEPTGSSVDRFQFAVTQRNHTLLFTHGDIRVEVGDFKLINAERWAEDDKHRRYPAVGRGGVGLLWYQADVEWQAGEQKGKADNVALGHGPDRDRALTGLMLNSAARTVIEDLLIRIENIASGIFEDGLLDKQPVNTERKFADDRQGGRQWQDKF